ncbi:MULTISPECIES: DUF134 domain-containing protein [unclassified Carboxydocella]|uniref:DUF134 domain-containing protein n=1 Tax=unclassified Carboxydocella TaxID=2685367 RepID=UPI0009AC4056|nr:MULTISPECIES: DUF134 domain-containing protein [unclassified Carboxydocella]GAW28723.1 hypothetical protein ULO1_12930 [Carboxydocella sp. ULO1]GAW30568.1 hypothetical protein JDF658_03330 [Carboxydocella sp. JDF658]
MVRPTRCRHIRALPWARYYKPAGVPSSHLHDIELTFEELEAIRLKDYLDLEQEECAQTMGVSRPTFHRLLKQARQKIAHALLMGHGILIHGGGRYTMKIAIPTENGQVNPHFGRSRQFTIVTVEDNQIVNKALVDTASYQHQHGRLAELLQSEGVSVALARGIGQGAMSHLQSAGINVYCGASGTVEEAVAAFLAGKLTSGTPSCGCGGGHSHGHHRHSD